MLSYISVCAVKYGYRFYLKSKQSVLLNGLSDDGLICMLKIF